ncbi:hypothetical protein [Mycobacterium sp. SA01]|uniref:hypothetical protein n=1 Tax=Mycobacterium sp. SA01 TaxID=3238820 RepID=UPI00351B066C
MTTPDPFTAQVFRHRPFTPTEISKGREMALDAWEGLQLAKFWAIARSMDPPAPEGTEPTPWSTASTTTVTDAEQTLRWLKEN